MKCPAMTHIRRNLTTLISLLLLSACSGGGMPQLFWPTEDGTNNQPAYARGNGGVTGTQSQSRAPLEVPPELRAELELPGDDQVASRVDESAVPESYRKAVSGKAVALHAKVYDFSAGQVFSAVVDAMTSLNLPVDSVDSPSGIITTDWVRRGENSSNIIAGLTGRVSSLTRHRFIVRMYRLKGEAGQPERSRLEVRVLSQVFQTNRWVNAPIKRKVSKELFSSIEEQLTRMRDQQQGTQPAAAAPAN